MLKGLPGAASLACMLSSYLISFHYVSRHDNISRWKAAEQRVPDIPALVPFPGKPDRDMSLLDGHAYLDLPYPFRLVEEFLFVQHRSQATLSREPKYLPSARYSFCWYFPNYILGLFLTLWKWLLGTKSYGLDQSNIDGSNLLGTLGRCDFYMERST